MDRWWWVGRAQRGIGKVMYEYCLVDPLIFLDVVVWVT